MAGGGVGEGGGGDGRTAMSLRRWINRLLGWDNWDLRDAIDKYGDARWHSGYAKAMAEVRGEVSKTAITPGFPDVIVEAVNSEEYQKAHATACEAFGKVNDELDKI